MASCSTTWPPRPAKPTTAHTAPQDPGEENTAFLVSQGCANQAWGHHQGHQPRITQCETKEGENGYENRRDREWKPVGTSHPSYPSTSICAAMKSSGSDMHNQRRKPTDAVQWFIVWEAEDEKEHKVLQDNRKHPGYKEQLAIYLVLLSRDNLKVFKVLQK